MTGSITRLNAALEGRYRIEREIGDGGMATVYLADDLKHERKVALKVLKPELAAVVGAERFLAEIKTTANLQHPHILTETGTAEVFVRPFPDVDSGKTQVSTDGGTMPVWAHSGRELFYVDSNRVLVTAQVETEPSFQVGAMETLFTIPPEYVTSTVSTVYDIAPGDQRFLMARDVGSYEGSTSIILVQNFFEELKARVPR